MVEMDPGTPLMGPNGPVTLLETFEGRRLLIAYYFMRDPGRPAAEQCEGSHPTEKQRFLVADAEAEWDHRFARNWRLEIGGVEVRLVVADFCIQTHQLRVGGLGDFAAESGQQVRTPLREIDDVWRASARMQAKPHHLDR